MVQETLLTFLFLYNYGIIRGCNAFSLGGILIFHNADTDGSEDPDSERMTATLYIPIFKTKIMKYLNIQKEYQTIYQYSPLNY